jgi:hypothetical protein
MRYISLVLFLGVLIAPQPLWAQAKTNYGLSNNIHIRIEGTDADYERMIRSQAPEFRLVKDVEKFPPIKGKTVPVPVNIDKTTVRNVSRANSPPIIVTLHDRRTGKPLDNCIAPCTLTSPMIPPGMLTLYRYGSAPINRGAEMFAYLDRKQEIFVSFNVVDHRAERERCAVEFEALRALEPTRDAEACVRVPPLMPMEAERSGHCKVIFNVSRDGETIDVRAVECTDQLFCEASLAGVQRWIYYPKLKFGETEVRTGASTTIRFRLNTIAGAIIPEPDGEMVPCVGSV